jgi:hypothetical protein
VNDFISHVKGTAPECTRSHCTIYYHTFAVKISNALKTMLDGVKIVNFIKSKPMNSRIFSALCNEVGGSYTTLLLYTVVQCLS